MTSTPLRRATRDRLIAAAIALVVIAAGVILYERSDIRAAASTVGPSESKPTAASDIPTKVTEKWSAPTDSQVGTVATPDGMVAVTDQHSVTGRDAVTGQVRWSYERSNLPLCTVGSGDRMAATGVAGVVAVYRKNGFCSQVQSFDSATGARSKVRTSPNPDGGRLVFGDGYAGWLGSDLVEIWRNDLVRTAQYGNQPNPPNPGTQHLGCTFSDLAIAATQYATVEHCKNQGPNARVVLNFDDPGCNSCNYPSGWDNFKFQARIDKDTGSRSALIVGITPERVAIVVSSPTPAMVVYDAAGTQVARTPVDIPAAEIDAAAAEPGPTPAMMVGSRRISLIGSHLLAVDQQTVDVPAPSTTLVTPSTTSTTASESAASGLGGLISGTRTAPSSTHAPQVTVASLVKSWVASSALGLPAVVGGNLLIPVSGGLSVVSVSEGPDLLGKVAARTVAVDRGTYRGRVDAAAVGSMIIETRGDTVVGLSR